MLAVSYIEAHDRMRYPWRTPVIHEQIDTAYLRKIDVQRRPFAGVIEFSPVIALAKLVGDGVAVAYVNKSQPGYVSLPRLVIGRLERKPP